MAHRPSRALVAVPAALALAVTLAPASGAEPAPDVAPRAATGPALPTLPSVHPVPQEISLTGTPVRVGPQARVLVAEGVDDATVAVVTAALEAAGARRVAVEPVGAASAGGGTTVVVGPAADPAVAEALVDAGGEVPDETRAEGYALVTGTHDGAGLVVLAGDDADGTFYAAQTLRQVVSRGSVASVEVRDFPSMPLRGSIEGFYGAPWTHGERLDHLDFLGDVKANTYIYSPKDDPYLREEWREPHPADDLALLGELVAAADDNHVRLTYALSPGNSICYSDPGDLEALVAKLDSVHAVGARSFYVALDDISYTEWNCAEDQAAFGDPGEAVAGTVQAELLNAVQEHLDGLEGTQPLQMVPTEYYDNVESPYKERLRTLLDPRVVVQWTGTDVVPPQIGVADAERAADVFGRPTFLWDNYPVNDFGQTEGRLLLAPYDRRQAGLSEQLAGIVLNPMNQSSPSEVALLGGASFAWNDQDYDATEAWRGAARYLAGGDTATTEALLRFFDTQHLAPTFGDIPWQAQAPRLDEELSDVRDALASGSRAEARAALTDLAGVAGELAAAPQQIRDGVVDPRFAEQSRPWLDATALWGRSLQRTTQGLQLALRGDARAADRFAQAETLAARAAAIETVPGTTRPQGPVRVADGVLDTFVADAPGLVVVPAP